MMNWYKKRCFDTTKHLHNYKQTKNISDSGTVNETEELEKCLKKNFFFDRMDR